tara:strand:- start:1291 stop:2685 length:1395 start_codon:yes stop_codon:yes gene_type:complete
MAKKIKDLEFGFQGEVYKTPIEYIPASELNFWEDNPRIFNKIRRRADTPISQKEIENFFFTKNEKWARELMGLIVDATRVNDPLYVQFCKEDKVYIVYEGNTRLAAVRKILKDHENHKVPSDIPCRIIPEDVNQDVINAIVGQAHLKGKKEWDSYELNSYLCREFNHRKQTSKESDTEIREKLKREFGVQPSKVKTAVKTFAFMDKFNLTDTHWGVDKYSHWEEYNKTTAKEKLNFFNDPENAKIAGIEVTGKDAFDKAIVKLVKSPDGPISYRLKEDLRLIAKASDTGNFEPIKQLIGGSTLEEAVASVDEDRQDVIELINNVYKKIQNISTNAIKNEINKNSQFKRKVRFIKTFLTTQLNLKEAIKTEVQGSQPFIPKNPKKIATLSQANYLSLELVKVPSADRDIVQKSRCYHYFKELIEKEELTQGKVYEILMHINDKKKIPKSIIDDLEDIADGRSSQD